VKKILYKHDNNEISEKIDFMRTCQPADLIQEWNRISCSWDTDSVIKIYNLIGHNTVMKMIYEITNESST